MWQRADALNREAWAVRHQDAEKALELADEAHTLASSYAYPKGVAHSLLARAFAQFQLARLRDAQTSAEQSRELLGAQGDKQGLVRALNTLGIVYGESGQFLAALGAFLDADVLCKELDDPKGEADALNNSGNVYAHLSDYVNALDYYQQSLKVCEEQGFSTAKARALLNIGVAYFELEQYSEALPYFSSTLAAARESEPYLHALSLFNLGRTYRQLGEFESARIYVEQSLELSRTLCYTLAQSYALDTKAELELSGEDWPAALAALQESLELKEKAGDLKGQSQTLLLLASVSEKRGKPDVATAQLEKVLEITAQVGNPRERYRAYRQLSDIYERQGRYREALGFYQHYDTLREQVSSGAVGQQMQGLRLRFEVSQTAREREIYRLKNAELARLNTDLQTLNDALKAADTEKSQLLTELARQAKEDALTGLYNRRYFDEVLAQAFGQAQRLAAPLSVAISDIDNFKSVNDRFSHQLGDTVLRTVAALMKGAVRGIDTVARYGGEEFVVLLPAADAARARAVCERVRTAVENYPWAELEPDLKVTLSIGICDDLSVINSERMVALADDNLYKAKRSGKNQVQS